MLLCIEDYVRLGKNESISSFITPNIFLSVGYLKTPSESSLNSVRYRIINDCGAVGGMKISKDN
jgi:hypothetical protein